MSLLQFFSFVVLSWEAISGVPCIKKTFVPPVTDKALVNHVINSPTVTSAPVCEIRCFMEVKCESYNFGPTEGGGHVCELSDSDAIRDPLDWITKQGFIYRGTQNPCANAQCPVHTRCHSDFENDTYVCLCPPGYTGDKCKTDIDECASSPCANGAVCVDQVNRFYCTCPPGFAGALCDINIDECASSPCANGAVCVDQVNHFNCTCPPGFTGALCDINIDECASSPCANGAVCVDQVNHFNCTCPPGFTGALCDINTICEPINPCVNGGTCASTGSGGYICTCPMRYGGANCEFGDFLCERSSTYTNSPWPNTGKFDKIAFSISANQYILGIIVISPVSININVQITAKLTDMAGNLIAKISFFGAFSQIGGIYLFFDQPHRITAGEQYIAATRVYVPPSTYPDLLQYVNMVPSTQCGPLSMTVRFSTVPQEELDDSNGSTVDAGRVSALIFKPL